MQQSDNVKPPSSSPYPDIEISGPLPRTTGLPDSSAVKNDLSHRPKIDESTKSKLFNFFKRTFQLGVVVPTGAALVVLGSAAAIVTVPAGVVVGVFVGSIAGVISASKTSVLEPWDNPPKMMPLIGAVTGIAVGLLPVLVGSYLIRKNI